MRQATLPHLSQLTRRASSLLRMRTLSPQSMQREMQREQLRASDASEDEEASLLTERDNFPVLLRSTKVYRVYVSIIYGIALLLLALWDIYGVYQEWDAEATPPAWHTGFVYAQAFALLVLLLGLIVAFDTNHKQAMRHSFISLAINLLAFTLRLYYELFAADFMPVKLSVADK
jgi:hypothetical protein